MNEMNSLLLLIDKLNISKVALARYLQVSRQMVYIYLSKDDFDDWPIKKKIKILELFDVDNINELEKLEVTPELYASVNAVLTQDNSSFLQNSYDSLDNRSRRLVEDVIRLCEEDETRENINVVLTLIEHSLISDDYKYLIAYLAKIFKKMDPEEFSSNELEQKAFEGILFSAFNLFNSGKYSKDKTSRVHAQFVKELKESDETDLQATNIINVTKLIAKNELGIEKIDETNVNQVLEKMLEIQGRKL